MIRVFFVLILVALVVSCASTLDPVPQSPDVDIQFVDKEVPCIVGIEAVDASVLPDYPSFDEDAQILWAKELRRVYKLREVAKDAEIAALRSQIEAHNRLEPKCSE